MITENPDQLLEKHAQFVAENQFYDNPLDPFNRHHTFLPYDDMLCTPYVDSIESWQVGSTDELCLPPAMFLAEKNIFNPNVHEIEILETFIEDGLFGKLQNRDTYLTVRSLYWTDEVYLSDQFYWGRGTKEWANSTNRCFQYALIADIYYAMN